MANKIDISVIIASYNSTPLVFETLESLRRQEGIKPCEYDVFLADSSKDSTNQAVAKLFPEVKVVYSSERKFPGAARNMGIKESSGEILAFIDADAIASPHWLERIRHHHQVPGTVAIGGPILNGNPQKFLGWVPYWCEFTGYTARSPETQRRVIPTCNLSIKREAFQKYGPFLEEQFGNEDVLLTENLRKAGLGPLFKRDMPVHHINRHNWAQITAHLRKLGMSTGMARVKYDVAGAASFRSWKRYLLIPITPLYKAALIWGRVTRDEPERLPRLAAISPWIIAGLIHWTIGMSNGLRQQK